MSMNKFCTECGTSLPFEAKFCAKCGTPQGQSADSPPAQMTSTAPGLPGATVHARDGQSVTVVMVQPKSGVIAGILEWVFPGLGMIYANRTAAGLAVLAGTVTCGIVALAVYGSIAGGAQCQTNLFGQTYCANPDALSGANAFLVLALILSVCWLIARTAWAVGATSDYNRSLSAVSPARGLAGQSPSSGMSADDIEAAREWNARGYQLFEAKRYSEALEAYERSLQLNPTYTAARNNKAKALQALSRYGGLP